MSETIAIRITTVSPVSGVPRYAALGSVILAAATAEAGRRLLSPGSRPITPVPVALDEHFSPQEIERGRRFARPQLALGVSRSALELGMLALLARRPPRLLTRAGSHPVAGAAGVGAALALGLTLPTLPLRALARRRSIAVGLDTQSWRGWGADLAKANAIGGAFAAAAGATAVATTRRYPRSWWLPAAAGSVGFGALLAALAPVVLDPLFNHFTPLPEGRTRSDVLELARAAGVTVGEVYSVDASRRTTAANAYVTGLGPTKRVVLFDTLLDRYGRDEIRGVVAHELAHVRHRDVPRGVLYAAIVAPGCARAVQRLSWVFSPERGTPATLPALALAAALVGAPIGMIGNRLSRAIERRADTYALELSQAPQAFVSFERTAALQNVADLAPPRWVTALLSTHPPTAERIGAALAFAQRGPTTRAGAAPSTGVAPAAGGPSSVGSSIVGG
jgi:STE24 endopeptidase